MMMRRKIFFATMLMCVSSVFAQFNKASYYSGADGKKGSALKSAMCKAINRHKTLSYDYLWTAYKTTDVTSSGYIWDMYSNTTQYVPGGSAQGKSYSKEGDSYNREHSVPQSWFNKDSPMRTDLYHVLPTDGYVNNRRSNYDFGEVGSVSYQSNNGFSKLGSPNSELKSNGCSEDKVFEPNDMYKGDFARIYFYMVTCYEERVSSWSGSGMLNKTKYPAFSSWALKMLLKWSKNDQVSQKETDRVENVYDIQENRNPFVDFPGLEQYIWGTWADSTFSVSDYRNPYEVGNEGGVNDGNGDSDDKKDDGNTDDKDDDDTGDKDQDQGELNVPLGDYALVKSAPSSWTGVYLIAYEDEEGYTVVFDGSLNTLDAANNVIDVSVNDDVIASSSDVDAASFKIQATGSANVYSVLSSSGYYIGKSSKKNGIETSETYSESLGNKLSIDGNGYAVIEGSCGYALRFNTSSGSGSRFRYYSASSQQPIKLYRKQDKDTAVETVRESAKSGKVYDLNGRVVSGAPKHGIYIIDGKKVVR